MIDTKARKEFAELTRYFSSGQITNFEFEERVPKTADAAISAIEDSLWCLYDDFKEHKINEHWEVPKEVKEMLARWVMFLHTKEEYVWPKISHPGSRPFKYGFIGKLFKRHIKQENFLNAGEYSVWPFISTKSYENAKESPKLLVSS